MYEQELQQYLLSKYPRENEGCEWKEFKNLKLERRRILEGLHNSIAHQKYECGSRIIVTEDKDKLTFQNDGNFYEGNYK